MRLAGDVDLLLTRSGSAPDGADVIVLSSLDRDFRSTIDRARSSKRIVVLGLREGMSKELRLAAGSDIRFLDERLGLAVYHSTAAIPDDMARMVLHAHCWLREHGWHYAYADKLEAELQRSLGGAGHVARGLEAGVFLQEARPAGQALRLAADALVVQAVWHLAEWVPRRIKFCLNEQGRSSLNTGFLHNGMKMDERCRQLGIGQTYDAAEAWLEMLAEVRLIVKRTTDSITWWPLPTN